MTAIKRRSQVALASLALLTSGTCLWPADNKNVEASALLDQGRTLSDIWARGAAPFRLEAKFAFTRPGGASIQGTDSTTFEPPDKEREEINFAGYSETVVRGGGKAWVVHSGDFEAFAAFLLRQAVNLDSHFAMRPTWKVKKVAPQNVHGVKLLCVTAGNQKEGFRMRCFDPSTGYLISDYGPTLDFDYAQYASFEGRAFPRSIQVMAEGGVTMKVQVESLTSDLRVDSSGFEPPAGGRQTAWCDDPTPPEPMGSGLRFVSGPGVRADAAEVEAWAAVGYDGRLHYAFVTRKSDPSADMRVFEKRLGLWAFRPAMCGDSAVEWWTSLIQGVPVSK